MTPETQPISSWLLSNLDTVVYTFGITIGVCIGYIISFGRKIVKVHKLVGSASEFTNRLVNLEKETLILQSKSADHSKFLLQMQNEIAEMRNTSVSFPDDKAFKFNGIFYTYIGDTNPSFKNRNLCPVCLEKIPHKLSSLLKSSNTTLICYECKNYFYLNTYETY